MAKKTAEPVTYLVVNRLSRAWASADGGPERLRRYPGEVRLQAFDTFAEADADCRGREAEARRKVNPFLCGAE
jgi:hypothetical protein